MVLSYKKQFVQKILDGTKIHTIREDPTDRWHKGRKIHSATGVRSKNYNCFYEDECVSTQKFEIKYDDDGAHILVDGMYLDPEYGEPQELAWNDGFDSLEDFLKWFDSDFKGKIIHWTDFKY